MYSFFKSNKRHIKTAQNPLLHTFFWATLLAPAASLSAQEIQVADLNFQPTIDGIVDEWAAIPATTVTLKQSKPGGKSDVGAVDVRFARNENDVCFVFQWQDNTHDNQHKPYIWDEAKGKYVKGSQREDRLAVQFAMSGDYDSNWLSGKEFTADTWHWKAARSNPAGVAQDKMTIISKVKAKKSYKATADDGSTIYIQRPSDKGDKLYKTKRYATKEGEIMPKYIVATSVNGSIADVKAKGVWANNTWTLEGCRKMNTQNPDDVVFKKGQSVAGAIAVFNHSGNDDHNTSGNLLFKF